jgi:DNA-binding ferritin-like protein
MAKNLKTDWKRIGRSGPTVDGRIIEPAALEQAAKNYKKELFTALIWPDHLRWFNMGTVEALRTAKNDEGGVDLFAIIAPNDFYLSSNSSGQRLFTSMELMPNFRDSGEYYLTGLAATDNPASAATSEMRFTSGADKAALLSQFTEHTPHSFNDDQPPGWFKRLFADKFTQPEEDAMKKALEALTERFTALEQKLDGSLEPTGNDNKDKEKTTDNYSDLPGQVAKLTEQFSALLERLDGGKGDAGNDNKSDKNADQFKQLADELKALRQEFNAAVNKADGTDAGEHKGNDAELSKYI